MTLSLPRFTLHAPTNLFDAVQLMHEARGAVTFIGGGTDVFPQMKRRQMAPSTLISLANIPSMTGIHVDEESNTVIGAATTLRELASSPDVPPVIARAAGSIGSPQVRTTGTVGGNLCLDTRCNYDDMPPIWRSAQGACLKGGGDTCWVAPRGNRCWAINASDLAPVAIALGGAVRLTSSAGNRSIPVEQLYVDDGIACHTKMHEEILVDLTLPATEGVASFSKLTRRASIDFALVNAAAHATLDEDRCTSLRLVVGAVASAPIRCTEAEQYLTGKELTPETLEETARIAGAAIRTQDNTDTGARYRKWMIPVVVRRTLEDLIDDPTRRQETER